MPFNGSGTFTRVYNWVTDKLNSVPITASRMETEDNGFAAGLSNCVTRDGQGTMSADFAPDADATRNLGTGVLRWKNLNLSGTATIGGSSTAALFQTFSGTTSLANNTPGVVKVLSGYGVYLVSATINTSNDATNYNASAIYSMVGTDFAKVTTLQSAARMSISTTGNGGSTNVAITQNSGTPQFVNWVITRIA